jgi:hypothetical protein
MRAMSVFGPSRPNFSLGPDVSFRGEAEVGRAAESAASVENDPQQKSRLLAGPDYLRTIFLKLQPDIEVIRKLPPLPSKIFWC